MPDEDEQKAQEIADSVKAPAEPNIGSNSALDETVANVAEKIDDAESILVTLSKNPSVDEISAALGLTLLLDRIGKHVTAIYSGKTPDVIRFLEPEKTFETNTDSLQDFIISLNKEKADHLRYKIEGDFVRVYITPYKTKITSDDLEFSEGEVNVDLVICLNVQAVEDLDAALSEHGRIMHDAGVINISNAIPGRIGGLEWNDVDASSVSEMIVKLMDKMGQEMSKDIATALLTGIMAETERFSNEKTSPSTLTLASELMKAGADQQLVAAHVVPEPAAPSSDNAAPEVAAVPEIEPGSIEVKDDIVESAPEAAEAAAEVAAEVVATPAAEPEVAAEVAATPASETVAAEPAVVPTPEPVAAEPAISGNNGELSPEEQLEQMISSTAAPSATPMMEELAQAVPDVAAAPEVAPEPIAPAPAAVAESVAPVEPVAPIEAAAPMTSAESIAPVAPAEPVAPVEPITPAAPVIPAPSAEEQLVAAVPTATVPVDQVYEPQSEMTDLENGVVAPLNIEQPKDYGAMMEEALAEDTPGMVNPAIAAAPIVSGNPEVQPVGQPMVGAPEEQNVSNMVDQMVANAQPYAVAQPVEQLAAQPTMQQPVQPVEQPMMQPAQPVEQPMTQSAQQVEQPMQPVATVDQSNPAVQAVPVPQGVELPPPPMPPIDMSMPEGPSLPPVQPPTAEQMMQPTQTQTMQPVVQTPVAPAAPVEPQDTSAVLGIPEAPAGVEAPAEPVNPVVVQPGLEPAPVPPVQDPGAFKIPGM